MGKTLNADGWRGFKAIPGPDGKIAKSLCLLCNKEYNRVDHGFHNRHRLVCIVINNKFSI